MTKRILMVLTSHDLLGDTGEKTGFWVEEFAAPYYTFIDAGFEVTVATPNGGQAPIDPKSELPDFQTQATTRYYADDATQNVISNTQLLSAQNAEDYAAVFYPGGHGPLWDLVDNQASIALINAFLQSNKVVSTVCHAGAVLLNVKDSNGEYVIKGKAVTGFTNSEEAAVELTDIVPFLLEDELNNRGAEVKTAADWHEFVVQDGLLITGQNPASSALVAQKLITHLSA